MTNPNVYALLAAADTDVIPGIRDFDGDPMTRADVRYHLDHDFRIYDADCPYIMSHTNYWCGHINCPRG